jgi:hypothetical protein
MMDKFTTNLVMILLFALRCVLPLVLTLLIGWAMDRLVDKWEAEEAAIKIKPEPFLPQIESESPLRPSMTESMRCWVLRDCGRTDCAAYQNPDLLCWQIKTDESGHLPAACQQCAYYKMANAIA